MLTGLVRRTQTLTHFAVVVLVAELMNCTGHRSTARYLPNLAIRFFVSRLRIVHAENALVRASLARPSSLGRRNSSCHSCLSLQDKCCALATGREKVATSLSHWPAIVHGMGRDETLLLLLLETHCDWSCFDQVNLPTGIPPGSDSSDIDHRFLESCERCFSCCWWQCRGPRPEETIENQERKPCRLRRRRS
jgi:hypothetical protein